ncbi:hypothetical protein Fot_30565 [Forsythia ovata]|uniref:Uncharacterized protein n=1 Tax=Forsythia ovata TaxID=205694 RepID=A0ABD1TV41_9LAMI
MKDIAKQFLDTKNHFGFFGHLVCRKFQAFQLGGFYWSSLNEVLPSIFFVMSNKAAMIEILGDVWITHIASQGDGEYNLILGLSFKKVSQNRGSFENHYMYHDGT